MTNDRNLIPAQSADAVAAAPGAGQPTDVQLINLCPHDVVVVLEGGELVVHPGGPPARCVVERVHAGDVRCDGHTVPIIESRVTQPPELPAQRDGVLLIVSRMVAEAAPERSDLLFPDGLIRDQDGVVTGCTALARLA